MTKIKKHRAKKPPPNTSSNKRWMRATGGYSTLKYVSFFVLGVGFLGLAAAVVFFTDTRQVKFTPLPTIAHTTEVPDTGELLRRINEERAKNNKAELVTDGRLQTVAEERLKDMVVNQRYSHKTLEGKYYYDMLPEQGYASSYSCENLDIENSAEPIKFVHSWLSSGAGHKECMLNDKVSKVGIASGRFSTDDKSSVDSFLVVVIFAAKPHEQSDKQDH